MAARSSATVAGSQYQRAARATAGAAAARPGPELLDPDGDAGIEAHDGGRGHRAVGAPVEDPVLAHGQPADVELAVLLEGDFALEAAPGGLDDDGVPGLGDAGDVAGGGLRERRGRGREQQQERDGDGTDGVHCAGCSRSALALVLVSAAATAPVQPQLWPSFCCCSHSCSCAKYSSTAEASICSPPVSSFSVFCQGWCEPCSSMARNFSPAALLP